MTITLYVYRCPHDGWKVYDPSLCDKELKTSNPMQLRCAACGKLHYVQEVVCDELVVSCWQRAQQNAVTPETP